ncbi:DNA-binding MarR family transcriptional regulator [Kitasatospora sp. MAP12-15]|uniref:MarR family winged helix-turn-helix transcriptional regulator n=1 Tax=unclassified Kitasatospora TaxID=2633591 RepID=UPI002476C9A1|nr:MarR family transcriptional regulator [Kitasatospora sp. MAP12-44]MDH6113159.1 DNA-binding MarR family transcriptional regulator [Kitasatospora sp. MAP12-44]
MTSPSADHLTGPATGHATGHLDPADGVAELADALTRAMKRIRRRTMDSLEPYGITPAQGRALRTLAHHTTGERALRLSELADLLHIAPRSATTVVDALEQAALVERVPDPADRRAVGLVLTAGGLAAIERLAQVRQEVAEDYFGAADPADLAVMLRVLRTAEAASPNSSPRHGHGRPRTA